MNEIGHRVHFAQIGTPSPSVGMPDGVVHLRVDPPFISLPGRQAKAGLDVVLPRHLRNSEFYLVADIYRRDFAVHPEGHIGWWSFPLSRTGAMALVVSADNGRLEVSGGSVEGLGRWTNEELDLPASTTLLLHLVLRHRINDEIVHIQSLSLYRDPAAAEAASRERANLAGDWTAIETLSRAPFQWPAGSTIRIVTQRLPAPSRMAHGALAGQLMKLLARDGIAARLYATEFDPELRGAVAHIGDLAEDVQKNDLLLILFDDHLAALPWLTRLSCTKIFYFLGLPDFSRLQVFDAEVYERYVQAQTLIQHAADCELWAAGTARLAGIFAHHLLGRRTEEPTEESGETQVLGARKFLPRLAPADRSSLTPLLHAASELDADTRAACEAAIARRTLCCRLPGRAAFWDSVADAALPDLPCGGTLLFFHGRLSPDEGIVSALELFAAFAANAAECHLVIAGDRPVRAFADYLEYLLATRFATIKERVTLFADLDDGQIKALYRRCDVLLHLGPDAAPRLEEAVHFAKPLFTSGLAVPHAGYRLYGTNREIQAARIQHFLNDAGSLAGLVDQQRQTLAGLDSSADDLSIWDLLETAVARLAAGS